MTGSPKQFAKNSSIDDDISEVTDWLDERQANAFDAIYVAPGTPLAIHTTTELKIDYDPKWQKVNHYANTNYRTQYYLD